MHVDLERIKFLCVCAIFQSSVVSASAIVSASAKSKCIPYKSILVLFRSTLNSILGSSDLFIGWNSSAHYSFYRPLLCCVRISRLFALDTWAICKMSKCLRIRKVPVTHWIFRLQASFERGWISSAIAPLWCVTLIHLNATYKMCNASNRTWCRLWLTNCGFTSTYILVANASFATNWEYWVESNVSP